MVGTNDLVKDLRARPYTGAAQPVFVRPVRMLFLVARANGLNVLDGVYSDFKDAEGFANECVAGARYGFLTVKTLIHPSQVEPANAAFSPTEK